MYKINKCAICFDELDNSEGFPIDFPDEWKLCCGCLSWAEDLVEECAEELFDKWDLLIRIHNKEYLKEKLKEIEKLIGLV